MGLVDKLAVLRVTISTLFPYLVIARALHSTSMHHSCSGHAVACSQYNQILHVYSFTMTFCAAFLTKSALLSRIGVPGAPTFKLDISGETLSNRVVFIVVAIAEHSLTIVNPLITLLTGDLTKKFMQYDHMTHKDDCYAPPFVVS